MHPVQNLLPKLRHGVTTYKLRRKTKTAFYLVVSKRVCIFATKSGYYEEAFK